MQKKKERSVRVVVVVVVVVVVRTSASGVVKCRIPSSVVVSKRGKFRRKKESWIIPSLFTHRCILDKETRSIGVVVRFFKKPVNCKLITTIRNG